MSENSDKLLEEIEGLKDELKRVKTSDILTGLCNRETFFDKVRDEFEKNKDGKYAVVCLDIERFKFINDRFGFIEGDNLLVYIADKLFIKTVKNGLFACRLSGDVFAFLDFQENIDANKLSVEINDWVKNYPLDIEIKISAGIYKVESKNVPVRLMCDRATFAIDNIKGNYMVNVAEYNKDVRDSMFSQHELLNDAESAFLNREFKVYMQPKFDIRSNKVVGAESLVRWQHPKKGLIMPKDFIPLFEQNMIIARLDEYVWDETCRVIRRWIDNGYTPVPVSVNVSRLDIYSLDVKDKFIEITDKYNVSHNFIEIEITESAFTNDEDKIIRLIDEMRTLGFKVLMDDFGSGYSSLNILKDISVDVLKIDTRFLEPGRSEQNKGKEILESVVHMAKWIGLQTIAEGVETDDQRRFLLNLGCYYAQGFYFARPMPDDEFEKLISNPENIVTDLFNDTKPGIINMDKLLHSDFMTESLLNNILGGVAIYKFNGSDDFRLIRGNETYYEMTRYESADKGINLLETQSQKGREKILKALADAKIAGDKGTAIHVRNVCRSENEWLIVRIFYLAQREGYELYYSNISDCTEMMNAMFERDMTRKTFETALELTEAIVIEYVYKDGSFNVKNKQPATEKYLLGTIIPNAYEYFIKNNIIHKNSVSEFKRIFNCLKDSDAPVTGIVGLLKNNGKYIRCEINAKSIYNGDIPVKALIVVKPTGEVIE